MEQDGAQQNTEAPREKTTGRAPEQSKGASTSSRTGSFFGELLRFALIALLIVVPVRVFVAQPYIVSGASMHPTFENGDYLIVDQLSYRFEEPRRGEVVIFRFPKDPSKFFIKRIVGLPGETVFIVGDSVTIINEAQPEGFTLEEAYISAPTEGTYRETLAEGEYFVLGDNRDKSLDSRVFGPVSEDLIVGKPFVRILPIEELGYLPGDHTGQPIQENSN